MLKLILDKNDPERSFVPFDPSDSVVLLVNNMGGMSTLEMYAAVDETLLQLGRCRILLQAPLILMPLQLKRVSRQLVYFAGLL